MVSRLIQVAGIRDADEARLVVDSGVDLLGFPFGLDYHREDLTEEHARTVIAALPPGRAVLITYLKRASEIAALSRRLGTTIVQLHADVPVEEIRVLRADRHVTTLIKSIIVGAGAKTDPEATLERYMQHVDWFITDTYDATTGASGATGKTHDWTVSRRLVELSTRPLILAGGLSPSNVSGAIEAVRPAGVDVHTGVEGADGRKDPDKLRAFVEAARAAFAALAT